MRSAYSTGPSRHLGFVPRQTFAQSRYLTQQTLDHLLLPLHDVEQLIDI